MAGWIAAVLPLALVLLSVALSPATNWIVRAGLAGFCMLAIARPDAALLVTTALVGFGFSAYLTYRELFSIHAICQWCVASAVLMTLLAIVTVWRLLRPPEVRYPT